MNVQFKKGVLTLCVLVLAVKRDRYGYELVDAISEKFLIAEGTIYPLLRRLTKEGYFTTYLVESQEGPPRKYYQLTDEGRNYAQGLVKEWKSFSASVNQLIEEGIEDDKDGILE
ncbi:MULTISPECIES: PadR family transcriptional regulator [Thermoactinomycetaceae]|uniref:PadR family transcriptional regulator n=2 Tax=Thermoactinomycetaceae TaxID=186824 RepID=A0A4R2S4M9_9BACL|nr:MULTISPECIES: PadR family transcriptional regulator [Thermoactinomycetaceae]TCP67321.1 PadR family transcriptional regulator [Baia soyae]